MIEYINAFGVSVSLYYLFWLLSLFVALLVANDLRKEYGFSFSRSIIFIVLGITMAYLSIWAVSWICGGGETVGFNYVRIVTVAPIYLALLAYLFKEPFWKVLDYFAPIGAIVPGVSHLGCIFSGCCQGYPSSWGIYSNISQTICFPIQPIEAITNILIGIGLCVMVKKKIQQKRLYMWLMVLFGTTRFVFEFFRDNEKIWNGLSELAFHALASAVIGAIALLVVNLRDKRECEKNEKNKQ